MAALRMVQAGEGDAEACLAVYAPYVTGSTVTFEYDVPAVGEFRRRMRETMAFYPWFLCLDGDDVVGYGYSHRHMARQAYQWNAELSVYLAPGRTGAGVGRAFFHALLACARLQHLHNVYSCIGLPNDPSERLQRHFGFERVGLFPRAGYKFGNWHDVAWYGLRLADGDPREPRPFSAVPAGEVERVLAECGAMLDTRRNA